VRVDAPERKIMDTNVRVRIGPASDHPRFARSMEVPVGEIRWRTGSHLQKSINFDGALVSSHITTGKVGRLMGIMDALSSLPVDGKLTATVTRESAHVTGELTVYQTGSTMTINGILDSVVEASQDLARDSQVRDVTITYTFEITSILGR